MELPCHKSVLSIHEFPRLLFQSYILEDFESKHDSKFAPKYLLSPRSYIQLLIFCPVRSNVCSQNVLAILIKIQFKEICVEMSRVILVPFVYFIIETNGVSLTEWTTLVHRTIHPMYHKEG